MEAEDTVMDKIRQAKLQLGDDFGDEEMMDEAIFKAGIKEVVEWHKQNPAHHLFITHEDAQKYDEKWQAKLKEWGIVDK